MLNPVDLTNQTQLEGTNKLSLNNNFSIWIANYEQNINFNYKYVSDTYYSNGNTIQEYSILNLSYNMKLMNFMKISFGIDNLINTCDLIHRNTLFPDRRYFINMNIFYNKKN